MIPEIEKASPNQIKLYQEKKLKELLVYLQDNSKYYQNVFSKNSIKIESINTIEDLINIPVTTKDQLQVFNDDFICVNRDEIVDYVTTSGTLGSPVTFVLTDNDLDRLAYNEAISFSCAGVKSKDVVQLMTTIDRRFMAGLAYFLGARKLGAGIIRVGAGIPELQWDSILKFKPNYLIGVPSFLLKLIEFADEKGIDVNQSGIKGVICIGESIREQDFSINSLSKKIKNNWNIKMFSTYASTEMATAFTECEEHNGGHHHPELIIVEILDENNNPVNPGEVGELVITTLGVEAMPLLRFKTGDMLKMHITPCSCGRNTCRLGPVVGRKSQMIKYKGTTLYPPALNNILNDFDEIDDFVIEIDRNAIGTDELTVKISTENPSIYLQNKIKDHFRAKLRVSPKIKFENVEVIRGLKSSTLSRKTIFFIDLRE